MSQPPFTRTVWVPLVDIRISERRSRSMRPATIEQYRLWLEQSRDPPAVRLAVQGDSYVVRDGRHRLAAARAAGDAVIEAEVTAETQPSSTPVPWAIPARPWDWLAISGTKL